MENKIVLATRNPHKIREISEIFSDLSFSWIGLDGNAPEIIEDGNSFLENAIKKSKEIAHYTQCISLADDSGIEVDALYGKPGIYSARFSGENATDEENNLKLLKELEGVEEKKRTARYRCVIALSLPNGLTETAEGICEGRITLVPDGKEGFGYDPIFFYPPLNQTFGKTDPEVKNKLSHRYHALINIKPNLIKLLHNL